MGPEKIFKNIYQIGGPTITSSSDCCVYLIDAGNDLVLIDSGVGQSFSQLVDNIKELDLDPRDIGTIVVTHGHIDHIGGLSRFRKEYDPNIVAHIPDTEWIKSGKNTVADMYNIDYEPVEVDTKLKEEKNDKKIGEFVLNFLHIPGHTPGSIACYLDIDEKRILFGQDIHGPYNLPGADGEKARKSLKKLYNLKADILCEGHSGIFRPRKNVQRFINKNINKL